MQVLLIFLTNSTLKQLNGLNCQVQQFIQTQHSDFHFLNNNKTSSQTQTQKCRPNPYRTSRTSSTATVNQLNIVPLSRAAFSPIAKPLAPKTHLPKLIIIIFSSKNGTRMEFRVEYPMTHLKNSSLWLSGYRQLLGIQLIRLGNMASGVKPLSLILTDYEGLPLSLLLRCSSTLILIPKFPPSSSIGLVNRLTPFLPFLFTYWILYFFFNKLSNNAVCVFFTLNGNSWNLLC